MVKINDKERDRTTKLYEICISVGSIGVMVVGAHDLLHVSPFLSIVIGGVVGFVAARIILQTGFFTAPDRSYANQPSVVGVRWLGFWLLALCAFRFAVGLSWIESTCIVVALVAFFAGAESFIGAVVSNETSTVSSCAGVQ